MTTPDHHDGASVAAGHYTRVLRRRALWVVSGALVGLLVAAGYLALAPRTATALSVLNIEVVTTQPFGLDRAASGLLDAGTEQQLASSYLVAKRASEMLDGRLHPRDVRAASEVQVAADGTVMRIAFTDADARLAAQGADAIADAYLEYRAEQAQGRVDAAAASIDERLTSLHAALAEALAALASAPAGSAEAANAEADRQVTRAEIDSLVQERTGLRAVGPDVGQIISPAVDGTVEYAPSRTIALAAGLLAGLLLGVVLAFTRDGQDRRVRGVDDLAGVTSAPLWQLDLERREDGTSVSPVAGAMLALRASETGRAAVVDLTNTPPGRLQRIVEHSVERASVDLEMPCPELIWVPSGSSPAEPVLAARRAGGVVLVVELGHTSRRRVTDLADRVHEVGAQVLAVLAVDRAARRVLAAAHPGSPGRTARGRRGRAARAAASGGAATGDALPPPTADDAARSHADAEPVHEHPPAVGESPPHRDATAGEGQASDQVAAEEVPSHDAPEARAADPAPPHCGHTRSAATVGGRERGASWSA
ncbi:hypothetical protein [Cellulomonas xiejunii]|uniref:hypothetical protein n=1 Tax=Cellulomonas xiejunii TaxID=2968083 RepID=UPI001D0DFF22|nr:hypothetical protein [Cellulomonas xiejunii]MCC2314580.1 hypothetical protein [Cellulomonas xiejunii]